MVSWKHPGNLLPEKPFSVVHLRFAPQVVGLQNIFFLLLYLDVVLCMVNHKCLPVQHGGQLMPSSRRIEHRASTVSGVQEQKEGFDSLSVAGVLVILDKGSASCV